MESQRPFSARPGLISALEVELPTGSVELNGEVTHPAIHPEYLSSASTCPSSTPARQEDITMGHICLGEVSRDPPL